MSTDEIKIAILGATGRTGVHILERALKDPRFKVVGGLTRRKDPTEKRDFIFDNMNEAIGDAKIIIDFSQPEVTRGVLKKLDGRKLIIGTTGFTEKENDEITKASEKNVIFKSANMSIGIGVMCEFFSKYNKLLNREYEIAIHEIHHKHKKDAPSGTALMLKKSLGDEDSIRMSSARLGEIKGIHDVLLVSGEESISIKHEILDRSVFAINSLKIALWLHGVTENGLYNMSNFLNQNNYYD